MEPGNTHVNPHYLDNVLNLSASTEVEAGEDIYSAKGIKLLAKGSRLDETMQERLIHHKLAKPLEQSITLSGGFDSRRLLLEIEQILAQPLFARMLGARHVEKIRVLFQAIDMRQPGLDLLLALMQSMEQRAVQHVLLTALVAVRLGLEEQRDESELRALALAGLLHQVGFLYLDPRLRQKRDGHPLPAWRQLIAQPLIAGMALSHIRGLSPAIVTAVREQHERLDGTGYPVGVQGRALSHDSQLFSVASLCARLLLDHGESGLWQTKLALQLVPGEYDTSVMSTVSRVVQQSGLPLPAPTQTPDAVLLPLFAHIGQLHSTLLELEDRFSSQTREANVWLKRMNQRLYQIQRTFSITGIDALAAAQGEDNHDVHSELLLICRDIRRRLHDMGKTGVLQMTPLPQPMQEASTPWLESLLHS